MKEKAIKHKGEWKGTEKGKDRDTGQETREMGHGGGDTGDTGHRTRNNGGQETGHKSPRTGNGTQDTGHRRSVTLYKNTQRNVSQDNMIQHNATWCASTGASSCTLHMMSPLSGAKRGARALALLHATARAIYARWRRADTVSSRRRRE